MLMRGACSLRVSTQMFMKRRLSSAYVALMVAPFFLVLTGHQTSASQETDVGHDPLFSLVQKAPE